MTGKQAVVVTPCVPKEDAVVLYNELVKINNNYTPRVCRQEHLSKVPDLSVFMTSHLSLTQYSFDFHKCSDAIYCGFRRTPPQFQVLAMQRQPIPRLDKDRGGHFLSRADAQARVLGEVAFTDLEDLPSNAVDTRKVCAKLNAKRDKTASKAAGIRSWEGSKVRAFIKCYECSKRRCVYAKTDEGYWRNRAALQQKLDTVAKRFCWGDLLFDDSHTLIKVLLQKQNITCLNPIEKGYYNTPRRRLLLRDICVHCGALGASGYLFGAKELREKRLTGGYTCLPICKDCLEKGMQAVKHGKKRVIQE